MSKLTPYGGAGSATGANFLLELNGKKILVDCGFEQGGDAADIHNRRAFEYDPKSIDLVFVTHAHLDHVGLLPRLYKEGFRGEIYSTLETKEIGEFILTDAAKINSEDDAPIYSIEDIANTQTLWKTLKYHEIRDFGGFKVELYDAGHVLGSSMTKITTSAGKTMLFTGDIGNSPAPFLRDREKVEGLDYLLIESVYGDRIHEDRNSREEKFKRVVEETISRGGTLLIPAFSLERSQIILYELDNLFEEKTIPSVPVYLDSPLAIKLTNIYEKVKNLYNRESEVAIKGGDDIFNFKELHQTAQARDSREIANIVGPKIIIAGSGMSTAGRILFHEERFLPDPDATILFMGYQAAGTLGRQIREGVKKVIIHENEVPVRAKVEIIDGFSGHADSNALVEFVSESEKTLKKVFVAMGETKSGIFLAQRIRDEVGVEALVAEKGKTYELDL